MTHGDNSRRIWVSDPKVGSRWFLDKPVMRNKAKQLECIRVI